MTGCPIFATWHLYRKAVFSPASVRHRLLGCSFAKLIQRSLETGCKLVHDRRSLKARPFSITW